MRISFINARRIAAHTSLEQRTVLAAYEGSRPVSARSKQLVEEAALALGLPLPVLARVSERQSGSPQAPANS
jgi:DNA-binding LacI/PurR family transcriptional regulator